MVRDLKSILILYIPITFGVVVFGTAGIYLEIAFVQGIDSANEWLLSFPSMYPSGMTSKDGYKAKGNTIGILVGILLGWYVAKYINKARR
jgi:hypothetical protein